MNRPSANAMVGIVRTLAVISQALGYLAGLLFVLSLPAAVAGAVAWSVPMRWFLLMLALAGIEWLLTRWRARRWTAPGRASSERAEP